MYIGLREIIFKIIIFFWKQEIEESLKFHLPPAFSRFLFVHTKIILLSASTQVFFNLLMQFFLLFITSILWVDLASGETTSSCD